MYVHEGMDVTVIAERIGVDKSSIHRWKRPEKKGDESPWDVDRREKRKTGSSMQEDIMDSLQTMLKEFVDDPDPKKADAIVKVFSVAKGLDRNIDKLGNTISVIEDLVSFCGEYYPDVVQLLSEPIERFLAHMREKYA